MSRAAAPAGAVFEPSERTCFARTYPETPHRILHRLREHPLLTLDALASLGESLPASSVEWNRGDQPLGLNGRAAAGNGLGVGETIRTVATSGSWAALKNIEQDPAYGALLDLLLDELRPAAEARTGAMLKRQGFVFVSSPGAVTPYHFDPEHNLLLQIAGTKTMTLFPPGDPRFAPDAAHEAYHTGGGRDLFWRDELAGGGREWTLVPGEALYVPVMAPHFVRNGAAPSVSLSITWRSDWSFAEADARAFNAVLRRAGLSPRAPGRWPQQNRAKALAWRALRRVRGVR